jgi:hypothetical protein
MKFHIKSATKILNPDLPNPIHNQSHQLSFKDCMPTASVCFMLGSLFNPEDGGDMILRNVGIFPNYGVLQFRIPYFLIWENVIELELKAKGNPPHLNYENTSMR